MTEHQMSLRDDMAPMAPDGPQEPMQILAAAVRQGADPESLERLSALAERWQDRKAAQEFADAMRAFSRRCPPIIKSKPGVRAKYAPLDQIDATVRPILSDLGLTYSWDSTSDATHRMMTVTCTLAHVNGHSRSSSFSCPCEVAGKGSTDQQKFAGAMTYARRYSLTAVLGITTADQDYDGYAPEDTSTITDQQAATIECLAEEVGADVEKFLRWVGAQSFAEIPATAYANAIRALESKRSAS